MINNSGLEWLTGAYSDTKGMCTGADRGLQGVQGMCTGLTWGAQG